MIRLATLMLSFGVAALAMGCGGGGSTEQVTMEKKPTVSAGGQVTYQGKPVKDAAVNFISIDGKTRSSGKTDAAGTFILSTFGAQDGAPPGKYKVIVAVSGVQEIEPGVLAPEPAGGFKSPIPTKYANPATTDLLADVPEAGSTSIMIELK